MPFTDAMDFLSSSLTGNENWQGPRLVAVTVAILGLHLLAWMWVLSANMFTDRCRNKCDAHETEKTVSPLARWLPELIITGLVFLLLATILGKWLSGNGGVEHMTSMIHLGLHSQPVLLLAMLALLIVNLSNGRCQKHNCAKDGDKASNGTTIDLWTWLPEAIYLGTFLLIAVVAYPTILRKKLRMSVNTSAGDSFQVSSEDAFSTAE